MPRKSNQTQYDDMMSVFKQTPLRSETQRHQRAHATPPARVADTNLQHIPCSHTPHSTHTPVLIGDDLPAIPAQPQPLQYDANWNEDSSFPPTNAGTSSFSNDAYLSSATCRSMQAYDTASPYPSVSLPLPSTSQPAKTVIKKWMFQIVANGPGENRYLPIEKFQIPQTQCVCGTHIRFLHFPTVANWQPPIGVLWNFRNTNLNTWIEGTVNANNECVSTAKCSLCQARLCLYWPHS